MKKRSTIRVKEEKSPTRRQEITPRERSIGTSNLICDEFSHKGAIVRIRIRNFMTYDDTEIRPGPNLNMILGPNGTGKSAIVCCVIVGLAGEVNLTGRAGSAADFVKKNTDWCSTEIELFNDTGTNFIIERKINITGRSRFKIEHKSDWTINGKKSLQSNVQAITKKLNIKVDNLCQFLPQDSVTQFVKMNTHELLVNTLKAAGDNQLVEDHIKLQELTKEVKEKRFALENLKQACKENEVNAKRLEAEVKQLRKRDELQTSRTICNQKIIYVKYKEVEAKYKACEEERELKQNQLKEIESQTEPLLREINMNKAEVERLRQCIDRSDLEVRAALNSAQNTHNAIEDRKMDYHEEFTKFKAKEIQERDREGLIRLKSQELECLECKLGESRNTDCSRELKKLEAEIQSRRNERFECQRAKNDLSSKLSNQSYDIDKAKRDIEQIQAVRDKKNNLLRAKFPESFRVLEWLASNTHRFTKQIYSPMLCEINVKDPKYNPIIEHAISRQELLSFVCQTEEDLTSFTRSIRDELKVRINVILAPEKSLDEFEFESSQSDDLSGFGVKGNLKDLIDAPEPIMRFLCGSLGFHKIPVSERCSEAQLKQLLNKCPKFYVGDSFYSVSRSRYDGQVMTVMDKVREAQLLIFSLDTKKLTQMRAKLALLQADHDNGCKKKEAIVQREDELRVIWQTLVEKNNDLKIRHGEKKRLETLIQRSRVSIEDLKAEKIDLEAERRKLQHSINKISNQIMGSLDRLAELYNDYVKVKELHMSNLLLSKLAERNRKIAYRRYTGAQRSTNKLIEEIRLRGRAVEELKIRLQGMYKEVKDKISGFKKGKLDLVTQKRFDTVEANTRDSLQAKINELTARIQMIYDDSSHTIMAEYARQTEELNDKRVRISDLDSRVNEIDLLLASIKSTWMPRLQEVIEVIDRNYGEFMRKLSYDGQVKLDYDLTRPNDFADYGIKILVKYRDNEQLIPLTSTRQSGGERSVATMIYMLALQTKTTVPFRCVDEINQGMDKENERKVFELLVQTADSSSSQYFLVSPKLLPNLPYSEKMKIHIVFNGSKLNLSWPNDFADYGIKILVKYRDNEQLIPLTSTRQSGGERSVTTMIYMLALQTKTTVPFRCVDEINQGMDKENERKVFELLVQTADSSSSHYFLVSPKLLPNLPYSEKMKIHIVFNGSKLNLSW